MRKIFFILLAYTSVMGAAARGKDVPRIVNFVNFARGVEPRDEEKSPQVLFETTRAEADALHKWGFKGTWLLQYDALIDERYQKMMREELTHGCEVGGWWEITQPHVEAAGLKWRGRYPWDWHAHVGFSVGYTPEERERLVDVFMEKFREVFGQLPHSIGSWFLDSHTLAYMRQRYGIEACCNCKDQVGTDGYTLWGGYWHGAYYPSRQNAYMPAQTREGQIDIPVFRMLGSDPLWQYSSGVGGMEQSVSTIEPAYRLAQQPDWVSWYLRCQTEDPALGYTYFQAGQENSFTWKNFHKGYELQRQGKLKVETLVESARQFRRDHSVTPVNACSALHDYTDRNGRTVWFGSRYYRANILWEGDRMGIRDIHLFDERMESRYLRNVCTTPNSSYKTLPIVDGCEWSTAADMASLRFYRLDPSGRIEELRGGEPVITRKGKTMQATWPLQGRQGEICVSMGEENLTAWCTDKQMTWCMQLRVQPNARLPFQTIGGHALSASFEGFSYKLALRSGTFEDMRQLMGCAFRIHPEKGKIVMNMNTTEER